MNASPLPWDDDDVNGSSGRGIIVPLLFMTLLIALAIVGNVGVILVVLRSPVLRSQPTYVFVLNLCVADLLGALAILPLAASTYAAGIWPYSAAICQLHAFFDSLFTTASVLAVCVISIERYYSIKLPLHYEVYMTGRLTVATLTLLWLWALLFAMFPLVGWGSYDYRPRAARCSESTTCSYSYVLSSTLACFVLPALVTFIMYLSIYRIARHTALQVHPQVSGQTTVQQAYDGCSRSNVDRGGDDSGVSCSSRANAVHDVSIVVVDDLPAIVRSHETAPAVVSGGGRAKTSYCKATRTLLVITVLYSSLWGPHWLFGLIASSTSQPVRHADVVEPIAVWLGFASFAVNPLVYGLLNRTIRETLLSMIDQCRAWLRGTPRQPPEHDATDDNENFFQFLERTSTSRQHSLPRDNNIIDLVTRHSTLVEEVEVCHATPLPAT